MYMDEYTRWAKSRIHTHTYIDIYTGWAESRMHTHIQGGPNSRIHTHIDMYTEWAKNRKQISITIKFSECI